VAREVFLEGSGHLLDPVDLLLLSGTSSIMEGLLEADFPSVYLSCEAEEMLRRIKVRGRGSESSMR
jgi:hypothetical protein